MNSRRLWNSHQSHKVLRAKASRDILKFRVLEMAFPVVFKRCFPLRTPCCFITIHARQGKCHHNVQGVPQHCMAQTFHRSKPVSIYFQCHSKLGNGCFTILYKDAYFLVAVMVEGDESSQLTMAN